MTNELKKFLERTDIQEALQNYDFKYIYEIIPEQHLLSAPQLAEFTELMLSLNYNPLNYMDYVPSHFLYWSKITTITIPEGINQIKKSAFFKCDQLETIVLPEGVEDIDNSAFEYCINLVSITIPSTLGIIGYDAFHGCGNLKTIYYKGTKKQWDKIRILEGNDSLEQANIIFKGEK